MKLLRLKPHQLKYYWIALGIVYLLAGSMMFWGGFHNIDYTRNFLKLAYMEDLDYESFGDRNLGGQVTNFDEAYVNGLNMSFIGFYTSIAGAAITCYGLSIKSK